MVDLGEDEEKFDAFMMPLTQSFESLGQVLLNQSSGYNSEEVKLIDLNLFKSLLWCYKGLERTYLNSRSDVQLLRFF